MCRLDKMSNISRIYIAYLCTQVSHTSEDHGKAVDVPNDVDTEGAVEVTK